MQYAHLGRSGVVVSRLRLGTTNFGWKTPEDESLVSIVWQNVAYNRLPHTWFCLDDDAARLRL